MATINDIAEKLHISNATVSRALRSSGYVKAELKESRRAGLCAQSPGSRAAYPAVPRDFHCAALHE